MRLLVRVAGEVKGSIEVSPDWPESELFVDIALCYQDGQPFIPKSWNDRFCCCACKSKFHRQKDNGTPAESQASRNSR